MKKKVFAGLSIILLIVLQMTAAVYALSASITAKEGVTVTPYDASGKVITSSGEIENPEYFAISYENSAIAEGEQYLIMLVAADLSGSEPSYEIADTSIKFMDQTVSATGSVSFEKVYPSEVCDSVILLTGNGLEESPQLIGSIDVEGTAIQFEDVPENAFYAKAVAWAVAHNVTNGTSSTTFSPNNECTRGQMVTFLWRAKGSPEPGITANPFTDVAEKAYYYKAVLWAVENGITNGISPDQFGPNNTVTRGQTVTFLWRMEGEQIVTAQNPFTDVKEGQFFTQAVLWAVDRQITNGISATEFGPGNACTRGQIVTFLYRDLG